MAKKPLPCPCGGADYASCCGRFHNGAPAPDAVMLMRSRYSAYALKLENYLLATWHPDTCPDALDLAVDSTKWISLEVKKYLPESPDRATVEFVARFKIGGRAGRVHEISGFIRENGRWLYRDAEFIEPA